MDHQQAQQLSELQAATAQQTNIEFCLVCGDRASGRHYGAISCEGCKGFFKRSIRKQLGYQCRGTMCCEVTKHHRNRCQYCRLQKCLACGMRSDSVQHERKPIVDRKGDEAIEAPATLINKCRTGNIKKDAGDPLNYLNLFQLNPFSFMNQANAGQPHYGEGAESPPPPQPQPNIKLEGDSDSNTATLQAPPQLDTNGHQELLERCRLQDALELVGRLETAVQALESDEEGPIHNQLLFDAIRNEQAAHFRIQLPNLLPNMFYVCEVGSRLLFKTIDWLKDVPIFADFSLAAQCSLLQSSWCELFMLGLAQTINVAQQPANAQFSLKSMIVLPLVNFLRTLILQQGGQAHNAQNNSAANSPTPSPAATTSTAEIRRLLHHLVLLHNFVDSIVALHPDDVEFAHLKLISLFNAQKAGVGGIKGPTRQMIAQMQLGVSRSLRQYIGGSSESSIERSQALLHTLPVLCSFERSSVEYMFFNNMIGHIQMENVIPYILSLNNRNHEHDLEELNQRAVGDDK